MVNYNIPDRKRKVTLQHFDLVWRGTLRGGEGREEMCLCWREKSLLPSFSFLLSLSFVPDLGLPGGLTGRWKRLYRNNKPWEETMGETERWQRRRREEEKGRSSERSRASTRVDQAHGSAPVLISITLTAQTYIAPPGKGSGIWLLYPRYVIPFPEMWHLWSQLD